MVVFLKIKEGDLKKIEKIGFNFVDTRGKYEVARMDGPCTAILYNSGKLLLQGNEGAVKKVKDFLIISGYSDYVDGGKKEKNNIELKGTLIGTDETLKGDTFGGIVVAGFKANNIMRKKLTAMGVQDSKNLSDIRIVELAEILIKKYPNHFCVKALEPRKYNEFIKKSSITTLLNYLHEDCFKKIYSDKAKHIVDKFPGANVGDVVETKAESKYVEVAAASIMARYYALKQIKELQQKAGFKIPLGSTHVESALKKLKRNKLDPADFVKMNFRNVKRVFG